MSDDFEIDWGNLPLIPAGSYQAVYVSHETLYQSFGAKIKITFRITDLGHVNGALINGWYNAKALPSKPGKNKRAILSRHSKLATELLNILCTREKPSRLSPAQLKGKLLEISVRTVRTNSRQKKYADPQTYSVVDHIERIILDDRVEPSYRPLPKPIPEPIPTSKEGSPIAKRLPRKWRTDSSTNLALEKGI